MSKSSRHFRAVPAGGPLDPRRSKKPGFHRFARRNGALCAPAAPGRLFGSLVSSIVSSPPRIGLQWLLSLSGARLRAAITKTNRWPCSIGNSSAHPSEGCRSPLSSSDAAAAGPVRDASRRPLPFRSAPFRDRSRVNVHERVPGSPMPLVLACRDHRSGSAPCVNNNTGPAALRFPPNGGASDILADAASPTLLRITSKRAT